MTTNDTVLASNLVILSTLILIAFPGPVGSGVAVLLATAVFIWLILKIRKSS